MIPKNRILGVLGLLIFLSLGFFGIVSLWFSSQGTASKAHATAEASTIPGGVKVAASGTPIVEPVLGATNPRFTFSGDNPNPALRSFPFYKRTRVVSMAKSLDLSPPAAGERDKAARRFLFDLFPDVKLIGQVERLETPAQGRTVYYGSLENVPGSDFILAVHGDAIAASFTTPGMGIYQIRTVGNGLYSVIELDPAALPGCELPHQATQDTSSPEKLQDIRVRTALMKSLAETAAAPIDGSEFGGQGQQGGSAVGLVFQTVDVLLVFTTNAKNGAGGSSGITALMDLMVARANSVFINSQLGVRVRMVKIQEVAYTEVNNTTDLQRIAGGTNAFTTIPGLRNSTGADLVALISNGSGGLAYLYSGFSSEGFSVTGQAGSESVFVHEIGHNFGCRHDRENNSGSPLYPYAYGWRFTAANGTQFRSVMAYDPGEGVPYFSNPDVTYMGVPTGIPSGQTNQSDNARVIRNTLAAVAAFRSPSGNIPPTVTLTSPLHESEIIALESAPLAATVTDSDGTISEVRFYRLKSDADYDFSNFGSTLLATDTGSPYSHTESSVPAGFWTYAAVARDNAGAFSASTVSVSVLPHYAYSLLPIPSGKTRVTPKAINESGTVVGFAHSGNESATNTQAASWSGGNLTLLNQLSGDAGAQALAISNSGVIYGSSISSNGTRRAVRWQASVTPTDMSAFVAGFVARGAVGVDELGRSFLSYVTGTPDRRFNDPGLTVLGTNERIVAASHTGQYATGTDVVLGSPNIWRALRWLNGTGTRLNPLSGFVSSWGFGINRSGTVAGLSSLSNNSWNTSTSRPTVWLAGSTTPTDLVGFGATGGLAYAVNNQNEVVGGATDPAAGGQAFLWRGGGSLINLNHMVLFADGALWDARAINNRGQIVGTGFVGSTQIMYLLDPLPGLRHDHWLATHFTPAEIDAGTITGDLADADNDTLSNLLERALGLNPRVAFQSVPGSTPTAEIRADNRLYFSYRRLRPPRKIQYTPEFSTNLQATTWDASLLETFSVETINDELEKVTVRTIAPLSGTDRAFIRLEVGR
jgi:hypothetical protein